MDLADFFQIPRSFADRSAILKAADMRSGEAGLLLIFDTAKQRTWLACDRKTLRCVFDILKEGAPRSIWSEPRENLFGGGSVTVQIRVADDEDDRYGYVAIGRHKRRKFSKRLFVDRSVESAIRHLIASSH